MWPRVTCDFATDAIEIIPNFSIYRASWRPIRRLIRQHGVPPLRVVTPRNGDRRFMTGRVDHAHPKRQRRAAQSKVVQSTIALWNQFGDESGSFADDHSTL